MGRKGDGNREGEYVICPLFVAFTDNELKCHPHVPEATTTILRYSNKTACWNQRKLYCEGNWKRCEHYIAWKHLMWEDED